MSYIPDMTERYPEGMRDVCSEAEMEHLTLWHVLQLVQTDVNSGDYLRRIYIRRDGKPAWEGSTVRQAMRDAKQILDMEVVEWHWDNYTESVYIAL